MARWGTIGIDVFSLALMYWRTIFHVVTKSSKVGAWFFLPLF